MDKIIEIENNVKHNQYRCPNCNSTEIIYDEKIGKLKCLYCKSTFDEDKLEQDDISKLSGRNIGKGAKDIKDGDIVTITCNSCGAEVVINSKEAPYARCHWCNSILSLDNKIENGAVPDVILPFSVSREEAEKIINDNVLKFKKIVDMEFIENLNSQHIKGVYFPYALVDANAHCIFDGEGLLKTNSKKNYGVFDYIFGKLCKVYREFDINIDDLSLETYSEIMNLNDNEKFNQIINSIMPFDTENCVPFKSNYLIGYSSEKRDIILENIASKINNQLEKICKTVVTENIKQKYCSINWERKKIDFKGKKIIIGYFPIWLYSYEKIISGKRKIFYIAVNGRTKEINYVLPFKISVLKKLKTFMTVSVSLFSLLVLLKFYDNSFSSVSFILLSVSFIIYITVSSILYYYYYDKMRERHFYEHETKYTVLNMISKDKIIENSKINVNNDNNN